MGESRFLRVEVGRGRERNEYIVSVASGLNLDHAEAITMQNSKAGVTILETFRRQDVER